MRPGRPVSRILLYPVIHLRGRITAPALLCGAAPTSLKFQTIWLARAGGLPGRSLSGYRRWALTPPFHPLPVPERFPGHRLVYSLLHLTLRALARSVPRVVGPSGLCYESGLCSTPRTSPGRSDGSDGPNPSEYILWRDRAGLRSDGTRGSAATYQYDARGSYPHLNPLHVTPTLPPPRILAYAGIKPYTRVFSIQNTLVGAVLFRVMQRRALVPTVDAVARPERLNRRRTGPERRSDPIIPTTFIHPSPNILHELPERNPLINTQWFPPPSLSKSIPTPLCNLFP